MIKAKRNSCLMVLAGLALAACSGGAPSNNLILETLNASDDLARIGCINYSDLIRVNGFPSEGSYRVEFRVNKVLAMSTDDCLESLKKNVHTMNLDWQIVGRMAGLAYLEHEGGKETMSGEMYLVKSEKGWVAKDIDWKK